MSSLALFFIYFTDICGLGGTEWKEGESKNCEVTTGIRARNEMGEGKLLIKTILKTPTQLYFNLVNDLLKAGKTRIPVYTRGCCPKRRSVNLEFRAEASLTAMYRWNRFSLPKSIK